MKKLILSTLIVSLSLIFGCSNIKTEKLFAEQSYFELVTENWTVLCSGTGDKDRVIFNLDGKRYIVQCADINYYEVYMEKNHFGYDENANYHRVDFMNNRIYEGTKYPTTHKQYKCIHTVINKWSEIVPENYQQLWCDGKENHEPEETGCTYLDTVLLRNGDFFNES